jgi:signal recognition particle subunit SRP54
MGDVVGLVEKAREAFDERQSVELERSLRKQGFTLEQFRDTLAQIKKMGPLDQLVGMLPGVRMPGGVDVDTKQLSRVEAIINSMTQGERRDHRVLNGSRRKRIARGSGTSVQEVNRVIRQYLEMQKIMKRFGRGSARGQLKQLFSR